MADYLTVKQLEDYIVDQLGGPPNTTIEMRSLVNEAGEYLVSMWPWRWLTGRLLRLRSRPQISLTDATWTEATKTLTKTGAFADYSLLTGDTLEVTAGTGATVGTYEVATNPGDDIVTLTTSIGAAADGQTDIAATMPNDQIEIAPDFDITAIIAYQLTDALVGSFEFTDAQGLLNLRSWPGLTSTINFYGLVNYVRSQGDIPQLRLDIWPKTSSGEEEIAIFYKSGWRSPDTDTERLSIPPYCNTLLRELFRAMVMAHEEPEGGSLDQRLALVEGGVIFRNAKVRDASIQPDVGEITNGWMQADTRPEWSERFSAYRNPVA